jgi:hypothetical protein
MFGLNVSNAPSPHDKGIALNFSFPSASKANPAVKGMPIKLLTDQANAVGPAGDGEAVFGILTKGTTEPDTLVSAHVYSITRVDFFQYTGTAPAIGSAVVTNGTGGVRAAGEGETGSGIVLAVDTARTRVEVGL